MNPSIRRILLIAAFVAVIIVFGYIIYVVFFRPEKAPPGGENGNVIINGLPVPGNGNINRIIPTNTGALPNINAIQTGEEISRIANGGPTLTQTIVDQTSTGLTVNPANNALQYYDPATGRFYQISPDGLSRTALTEDTYPGVQTIAWSPNGTLVIMTFPDGSKILYNFATDKQTTLPKELNDFSFSPQSDQIVSKYLDARDADNQWLMVSQPDGSDSKSAEHLGANAGKVITNWSPNNQIIATYQKSTDTERTDVIFLGASGENFQSANVEGRGFTPKWSNDGRQLLFSSYSSITNDNPHLYLMNGSPETLGTGQIDLGLTTTANKCTFAQSGLTIYCAVPYYLNPGSGPQPELSAGVPDNFYQIDLRTNSSRLIARPIDSNRSQRFSAGNLFLSPAEDALFFTDTVTGTIQRVQLR
jgi:hypothetical protein